MLKYVIHHLKVSREWTCHSRSFLLSMVFCEINFAIFCVLVSLDESRLQIFFRFTQISKIILWYFFSYTVLRYDFSMWSFLFFLFLHKKCGIRIYIFRLYEPAPLFKNFFQIQACVIWDLVLLVREFGIFQLVWVNFFKLLKLKKKLTVFKKWCKYEKFKGIRNFFQKKNACLWL